MNAKITYIPNGKTEEVVVTLSEIIDELGFDYGIASNVWGLRDCKIIKIEVEQ